MRRKAIVLGAILAAAVFARPVRASGFQIPPEAAHALDQTYSGDSDAAIATARRIESEQPQSPLGFLLEAEADWWKTYCAACEMKWGMLDAWKHPKSPEDDAYFALADKAIGLAQAQLAKSETAEMHLYAGLGLALKARLYGLRDEKRATAHAGVAARAEFVRALQLDPDLTDATAALGFYNYYVDTLSAVAKMLRFFMGIPGGNKEDGIRQMQEGADRGVLLAVDSRFYLAKNLRTYDQRYTDALRIAEPLVARYPHNPTFLLFLGNLNAELGRNAKAAEYLHAILGPPGAADPDSACLARARDLANSLLASLHGAQ
ncbi:MAG TPA: hypothetical protein VMB02_00100 [Candidatus Aquilonibacter sp.]|nr:hypothetical protein [Candidatus Aquilonibacter sp.]